MSALELPIGSPPLTAAQSGLIGGGVGDRQEHGVLHGLGEDQVLVIGRAVVPLGGQAVGVGEVGVLTAELGGALVHLLDEAGDAPGEVAAEDVAGLVGRLQHRAVEQILHGDHRARHDARGAGVVLHALLAVVLGGDHVLERDAAAVERLEREQHGHHLGETGDGALVVLVVTVQDPARIQIHQDRGLAVERGVVQRPGRGRGGAQRQAEDQDKRKNSEFFHFALPFSSE